MDKNIYIIAHRDSSSGFIEKSHYILAKNFTDAIIALNVYKKGKDAFVEKAIRSMI